ncbi:AmmeMemoRadiSam system protein A [Motiliproteus coralliicola]|uniref:AmmeMemoRadiSam system protein A n=1 Tax=Motiliproteus coralliicola TaxID=2283196 RepID=A0A369WRH4_9GAMM|nr:AmmeMemoRadiSam system protein A [Motiliproteus coralliicola]RDE24141.1 AmmeMemoRadiSam system protein A [Motiliproteus coralliicola]
MAPSPSIDWSSELSERQQRQLLSLARAAIKARWSPPQRVGGDQTGTARNDTESLLEPGDLTTSPWNQPAACFVTLHRRSDQQLRGCIGTLEDDRTLADAVVYFAEQAAFHDPRFPPMQSDELAETAIEISLLSPQQPLRVESEADLLQQLRPGVDGLKLESELHRATFLPQVWQQLPQPNSFVAKLKAKAGLAPDYWSDTLRWSVYQVWHFNDDNEP